MRLLLHVCCGPCAVFPVKWLKEQGHDVVGYFYNPNIHPYKEFSRRRDTAREFADKTGLTLVVDDRYTLDDFLRRILAAPEGRCEVCYELRLRQVARYAKANAFDCFSSTLLVSPYQQHEVIKKTAEIIAADEGIPFAYFDFRPGWTEGVQLSKAMELYRQPYCGCILSERDRYLKSRNGD